MSLCEVQWKYFEFIIWFLWSDIGAITEGTLEGVKAEAGLWEGIWSGAGDLEIRESIHSVFWHNAILGCRMDVGIVNVHE